MHAESREALVSGTRCLADDRLCSWRGSSSEPSPGRNAGCKSDSFCSLNCDLDSDSHSDSHFDYHSDSDAKPDYGGR